MCGVSVSRLSPGGRRAGEPNEKTFRVREEGEKAGIL